MYRLRLWQGGDNLYPIHQNVLDLFLSSTRQLARISAFGQDETFEITEKDIISGGLTIDRYCVSGNKIEVGTAIASEMTLELLNSDGQFDDIRFEGTEMYVEIGVEDTAHGDEAAGTVYYIPMGYFTVDNIPRKLDTLSITALDRMVRFDKRVENLSLPTDIKGIIQQSADMCNVTIETNLLSLTNCDYEVIHYPEVDTYRQLIQWCAEITGTCAYIDWEGKLRFEWYTDTDVTITPSERFSSDIQENEITVTGVVIKQGDNEYLFGTTDYAIVIEGNELIHSDISDSIDVLISYTPYSCSVLPFIHLYPLDKIVFKDKDGIDHNTIITNFTYTMNGDVSIEAKGETLTKEGYATANSLRQREQAVISTIENIINEKMNDRVQSVVSLNEAIAGSLGLYMTEIETDGAVKYYFHTNPTLQDSKDGDVIYTVTGGGFAVSTTGWNDGSPIWETGFTKEGNAVFNFVSAHGIEVADINTEYRATITPEAFEIWYRGMQMISANADESRFTKIKVDTYAEAGRVRIIPHIKDGVEIGTNIVFLD